MLKERASGMYRLSAFYFARTASDLPIELSAPSLLIILIYFMVCPALLVPSLRHSSGSGPDKHVRLHACNLYAAMSMDRYYVLTR